MGQLFDGFELGTDVGVVPCVATGVVGLRANAAAAFAEETPFCSSAARTFDELTPSARARLARKLAELAASCAICRIDPGSTFLFMISSRFWREVFLACTASRASPLHAANTGS